MAETWETPYIAWSTEGITDAAMNRIEGNIENLGAGGGKSSIQTATAAANLSLPNSNDDVFFVSGSTTIDYISTDGRQPGNKIHLIMYGGGGNIRYDAGTAPAGYAVIYGNGAGTASVTWYEHRLRTFVYSGFAWHHDMSFT